MSDPFLPPLPVPCSICGDPIVWFYEVHVCRPSFMGQPFATPRPLPEDGDSSE